VQHLVEAFFDYLTVERGLAANTRQAYREDLAEFTAFLHSQQVDQIQNVQPAHVTGFLLAQRKPGTTARGNRRETGLAVRSVVRRLAAIRMFFRFLIREKLIAVDPTQHIDTPKLGRSLPHMLDYGEVERLLNAPATDTKLGLRDKAMLELMYSSGLRISEVSKLTINDVNLDAGFLRTLGKGSKERIVPVGKTAADWLRRYLVESRPRLGRDNQNRAEIFLSTQGRRMSTKTIWHWVKKHAQTAGIAKNVKPHTLRHSFASHLLANGGDLRVIQEMLGHADISTTQVYTHIDEGRLKDTHYRFHPRSGRRP
jgi:integrase/recombinase XerD